MPCVPQGLVLTFDVSRSSQSLTITVTNVDPITGSDLDLESILMYPDNIKPLWVRRHSVRQQTGVSLNNIMMSRVT